MRSARRNYPLTEERRDRLEDAIGPSRMDESVGVTVARHLEFSAALLVVAPVDTNDGVPKLFSVAGRDD